MRGERGSGVVCLNGAAARLVQPDDIVIIISYVMVAEDKLSDHQPKVAIMNENNQIVELISNELCSYYHVSGRPALMHMYHAYVEPALFICLELYYQDRGRD